MGGFENTEVFKKLGELAKPGECKKAICEIHGEYVSTQYFKDHWSKCPVCAGIEMKEYNELEHQKMLTEQREGKIESWLRRSHVPERFRQCTFDNYKLDNPGQEKAFKKSKEYYNNFNEIKKTGSSLFYCGNYGTGKTHLAIAILLQLIRDDSCTGLYSTTMRMIRDIRSSYGNNDIVEQDIIDNYVDTGLLVLDEVGVQIGTEAEKLLIYEVVNGRYENYKPTILISNLSFNEMTEYLGARSIDRLKSKSGSMVVMDWESYRSK